VVTARFGVKVGTRPASSPVQPTGQAKADEPPTSGDSVAAAHRTFPRARPARSIRAAMIAHPIDAVAMSDTYTIADHTAHQIEGLHCADPVVDDQAAAAIARASPRSRQPAAIVARGSASSSQRIIRLPEHAGDEARRR